MGGAKRWADPVVFIIVISVVISVDLAKQKFSFSAVRALLEPGMEKR